MSEQAMIGEGDTVAEIASPFSEGVVVERVGTASVCVKFPRNGPGAAEVLRLDSVRLVRKAVAFPRYARVSLLGHRDLGLCRVTQERVGEATMLRCESVDAVTWTTPASVYALSEAPDGEAQMARERARNEALEKRCAQMEATMRADRAQRPVTLIEGDDVVGIWVEGGRTLNHDDLSGTDPVLADVEMGHFGENSHGVTVHGATADDVERGLRAMGFVTFTRRPAETDELDENLPF